MAPSWVALDLSDDIEATRSVFIIHSERDRYGRMLRKQAGERLSSGRAQVGGMRWWRRGMKNG